MFGVLQLHIVTWLIDKDLSEVRHVHTVVDSIIERHDLRKVIRENDGEKV